MREGLTVGSVIAVLLIVAAVVFCRGSEDKKMTDFVVTDPELSKLWNNFAIQEVRQSGDLDTKTKYLVILAGNVAAVNEITSQQ